MAWRLAKALEQLRSQINAAYPERSKASVGSIGDEAHASRDSDHNPWIKDSAGKGIVSAIDITHDPEKGPDGRKLSRALIGDNRVKYVIHAGEIWKRRTGLWEPYRGENRHDHHVHVSVNPVALFYDSPAEWPLPPVVSPSSPAAAPARPLLKVGSKGPDVLDLQKLLTSLGFTVKQDSNFGSGTEAAVKRFQSRVGLRADGKVGPDTWAKLGA